MNIRTLFRGAFILGLVLIVDLADASSRPSSPSCLNDEGKPVDWYIGYKFPELPGKGKHLESGYAYVYFTSEDATKAGQPPVEPESSSSAIMTRFKDLLREYTGILKKSPAALKKATKNDTVAGQLQWNYSSDKLLSDADSILMRTLAIAYGKAGAKLSTLMYNDDPPLSDAELEERKSKKRQAYANRKAKNGVPKKATRPHSHDENEEEERSATDSDSSLDSGSESESDSGASTGSTRKPKYQKAHAKGVVVIDDKSNNGFWITHSFPLFPIETTEELQMKGNTKFFGQTFLCVNFDAKSYGRQLIRHLANMDPIVYQANISDDLQDMIPEFSALIKKKGKKKKNFTQLPKLAQHFTSRAGQPFDLFSKSPQFRADIYSAWLDEELLAPLYVETWRKGKGDPMDSYCPTDDYQVNNIVDVKMNVDPAKKINWSYQKDHSKWAISQDEDKGVVCIGDMNRMESQFNRGGGLICIKCAGCWSTFSGSISDIEPCQKKSTPKEEVEIPKPGDVDWNWIEQMMKYF